MVVETDSVMAVFGIPVWIGDRTAIHERTAQPFPAREMIEPAIKLGMVGVVGEHGSAEQQQDQSQSPHPVLWVQTCNTGCILFVEILGVR